MQYGVITLTWNIFFFGGGGGGEGLYVITILRGEMFLLENKKFNYIRIMLNGGEYSLWSIQ